MTTALKADWRCRSPYQYDMVYSLTDTATNTGGTNRLKQDAVLGVFLFVVK